MQRNAAVIHIAKYTNGLGRLCNHECVFCMEKMELSQVKDDLPTPILIENVIKKYLENHKLDLIYVAGGEPTLRNDLYDVICIIKKYCETIIFCTNCDTQFDFVDLCNRHGIKKIATSLHGFKSDIHEIITGKLGSYNKTLENIYNLTKNNIDVTVNYVVCSLNYKNIIFCDEFLRCYNIEKMTFSHYINRGNAYYNDKLLMEKSELKKLLSKLLDKIDKYNINNIKFRNVPFCLDDRIMKYNDDEQDYIDILPIVKDSYLKKEKPPVKLMQECRNCSFLKLCPKQLSSNYYKLENI